MILGDKGYRMRYGTTESESLGFWRQITLDFPYGTYLLLVGMII